MIDFVKILNPETELERKILSDPEFIRGAMYGKERRGHPEGSVVYHIREVLRNIDKYSEDDEEREKLRLIALIHDSFKHQSRSNQELNVSISKFDNHHSRLAAKFAEKYINNQDIIQVIKFHDDMYNTWKRASKDNDWNKAESKAREMIRTLNDVVLYLTFYRCDNETGDKTQDDLIWFEQFYLHNIF